MGNGRALGLGRSGLSHGREPGEWAVSIHGQSPMNPYASKILRAGGLLLAVSTSSFLPGPGGYDAATGATATTPAPPPPPSGPRYVAQIKAGNSAKGSFTRTVAPKQEKFTGTVQLALPNAALGLTDAATAADAEIVLEFSRNGTAYAECTLDFAGACCNRKPGSAICRSPPMGPACRSPSAATGWRSRPSPRTGSRLSPPACS